MAKGKPANDHRDSEKLPKPHSVKLPGKGKGKGK